MVSKKKRKNKYCHIAEQIFCGFKSKWCGCSLLGDYFSAVARGRKWCYWRSSVVDAACGIVCRFVPECITFFLLLGLCRRPGCWPWVHRCLYLGHRPGSLCTKGRHYWTISLWSWYFTGIPVPGRAIRKILIRGNGWLPFVWNLKAFFSKGERPRPQRFDCHLRCYFCLGIL